MLSLFRKALWKKKKENRQLKVVLPSIIEEDGRMLEDWLLNEGKIETKEEQEIPYLFSEESEDTIINKYESVEVLRVNRMLAESLSPSKTWARKWPDKQHLSKSYVRNHREGRFVKERGWQIKIPRGRKK